MLGRGAFLTCLEVVGLSAAPCAWVHVRAARPVSLEDSAAEASWDVTRTP
jgi:hypothetical protein